MKHLTGSLLFLFALSSAYADDNYTHNKYTSITLQYWCKYKAVPTSRDDLNKIINVDYPDEDITIDLDDWLDALSYKIYGDRMTIIRESLVMSDRKSQTTVTSTSSSNCSK